MQERRKKTEQDKLASKRKYEENLRKTKPIARFEPIACSEPVSKAVTEPIATPDEEGVIKWVSFWAFIDECRAIPISSICPVI